MNDWLEVVNQHLEEKMPVLLISTKLDLPESSNTKMEEIEKFKEKNGISHYFKTSSLDGIGVDEAFHKMTEEIAIDEGLLNPA